MCSKVYFSKDISSETILRLYKILGFELKTSFIFDNVLLFASRSSEWNT